MNLGAFALVSLVARGGSERCEMDGFAGLARRSPLVAASMTVFLLSLAGIPPTAGFWGKVYIFQAVIADGHTLLAVIALLNSAVALFYYLRVIVHLYMKEAEGDAYTANGAQAGTAMFVLALLVLWIGLNPSPMAEWARRGVAALAGGI